MNDRKVASKKIDVSEERVADHEPDIVRTLWMGPEPNPVTSDFQWNQTELQRSGLQVRTITEVVDEQGVLLQPTMWQARYELGKEHRCDEDPYPHKSIPVDPNEPNVRRVWTNDSDPCWL